MSITTSDCWLVAEPRTYSTIRASWCIFCLRVFVCAVHHPPMEYVVGQQQQLLLVSVAQYLNACHLAHPFVLLACGHCWSQSYWSVGCPTTVPASSSSSAALPGYRGNHEDHLSYCLLYCHLTCYVTHACLHVCMYPGIIL